MKTLFFLSFLAIGLLIAGCKPECKTCDISAEQNTYIKQELLGTNTINSQIEYCGDFLEMIEANPVTTEESFNGNPADSFRSVIVTTYTCQ